VVDARAAGREQHCSPGGPSALTTGTTGMDDAQSQTADGSVALGDLVPDPRNARKHPQRNLALLEQSLREVGAARSVAVDERGVVLAGNATIAAAKQAGILSVRPVEADGSELVAVRRTGLTPATAT